nr:DUF998 domain-containing protein [Luteimonas sp. MC1895]
MAGTSPGGRDRAVRVAGVAAALCFAGALAGFGAALEGYDHRAWPVALLGASGVPRASAFNVLAYLLPGLLAAFVALQLRARLVLGGSYAERMGWSLALLAALAFAAQGLLPLDASAPDAGRGRLHGVAWALWGLAFAASTFALAAAAARHRRVAAALAHLGAGLLVFALGWLAAELVPVALAQRLAFAAWFAWLAWVAWTGRSGAPATG